MNEFINFFKGIIGDNTNIQRPVGLTSFRHSPQKEIVVKKAVNKNDVKLSDLMRRVH